MKKAIAIILAVIVLVVGGIVVWNQSFKYDEEEFAQFVYDHIQPDIEAYKEQYGWTDVEAKIDLSDITVVSDRKNMYDLCVLEGEVGIELKVKEIIDAVTAEEYSYDLYQQIHRTWFGLAQMYTQYHTGYDSSTHVVFVDDAGNRYTTHWGYDYVVQILKNDEVVFEKQLEKPKTVKIKRNEDGDFYCSKCHRWVSHVASNGYCSNCVDIYVNEWYIAIDGNVYVDRGY